MQVVNLEDGEEIVAKMDAMETAITGKINNFGDQVAELRNVTENLMKSMKEEITHLREELTEVRQELKKMTSINLQKAMKENQGGEERKSEDERREHSPEWEVVSSVPLEPSEVEEIFMNTLENIVVAPAVSEQIQKRVETASLKEEAPKEREREDKGTVVVNDEETKKKPTEEVCQQKSSSSSYSLPENMDEVGYNLPSIESKIILDNAAFGKVPLTCAVLSADIDTVRKLLKSNINIRMRDAFGFNALHYAAVCGFTDIAEVLLDSSKELVATRTSSKDYSTPLHLAAQNGDPAMVEALIIAGADMFARDSKGQTSLHIAAMQGHNSVVKLLLGKGAKVIWLDKNLQTSLHLAAKGGHLDVVNTLLDNNAEVQRANLAQQTALHLAAWEGHLAVVEVLFYRGSKLGKVDKQKYSALHCAAANGHTDIVKFLLSKNHDVTYLSTQNETALCLAAKNGHHETVKALVPNGVNLTISGQNALTALDLAASNGHDLVVCTLFEATSDIGGALGERAVYFAMEHNLVHALKALILEGAHMNSKRSGGLVAVKVALEGTYTECKMVLENAGLFV